MGPTCLTLPATRLVLAAVALLAPALWVPTAGAQAPPAPSRTTTSDALKIPYTLYSLKNGLTVILHEDHPAPKTDKP